MKYTGATLLATLLERQGIKHIPGIPGGPILPFYDALYSSRIQHILARHEQGAGFIAQGIARTTGKPAVCLSSSGPGATNLLTAIADARLDSIPLIAITGQVALNLIGTDAFQEVDVHGLTTPITKHNYLIKSSAELLDAIPQAFEIAASGRPGPVAIDIPKDILTAPLNINKSDLPEPGRARSIPPCSDQQIQQLAALIQKSKRPLLYIGGGIINGNSSQHILTLARRINAPVLSTLNALGSIPSDDPHFMGMLGMHGSRATHILLDETDLLLAIGARFDDRATGKVSEFCPRATIAHIDIDPSELGKIKTPTLAIRADAANLLPRLLKQLPTTNTNTGTSTWLARAQKLRAEHPLHHPSIGSSPLHPINLCRFLSTQLPADAIITTDVGQHQMWTAQSYPFRHPRSLLTSGGLGTMGFGLPAAIGASLAAPGRRIACITGDGSLLMNIQELATLADLQLPVAIIIFNNSQLGLVRQQQQLFYGARYHASQFQTEPNFAAIARAFHIRAHRITGTSTSPLDDFAAALSQPGPCLIDIQTSNTENVLPMVPPGAANRQTITHQSLPCAS